MPEQLLARLGEFGSSDRAPGIFDGSCHMRVAKAQCQGTGSRVPAGALSTELHLLSPSAGAGTAGDFRLRLSMALFRNWDLRPRQALLQGSGPFWYVGDPDGWGLCSPGMATGPLDSLPPWARRRAFCPQVSSQPRQVCPPHPRLNTGRILPAIRDSGLHLECSGSAAQRGKGASAATDWSCCPCRLQGDRLPLRHLLSWPDTCAGQGLQCRPHGALHL